MRRVPLDFLCQLRTAVILVACGVCFAPLPASAQLIDPTLPDILPLPNLPDVPPVIPPAIPLPPIIPGTDGPALPPLIPGLPPILSNLPPILPGSLPILGPIEETCSALSQACSNLLDAVAQQVSTSQQVATTVLASTTLQTTQQVADFALSDAVIDTPLLAPSPGAVLRSLTPTFATFGISGVSRTYHDGFSVRSPGESSRRSAEFESLDTGVTLGMRFDASSILNWSRDTLTMGFFGNYTDTDIDLDSSPVLRDVGISRAGDASLQSGSAGGFAVVNAGRAYGLILGSGEWGEASARDALLGSHSTFDVSGVSSTAASGVIVPAGSSTKLDFRGALNYLNTRADNHQDSVGIHFGEGELDQFSGTISARLFSSWMYGQSVVRPFVQGGVDYRFSYDNKIVVENVQFDLEEGKSTVFGRLGVDLEVGDYIQTYVALRGDHNEDFDIVSGQLGLTVKLN